MTQLAGGRRAVGPRRRRAVDVSGEWLDDDSYLKSLLPIAFVQAVERDPALVGHPGGLRTRPTPGPGQIRSGKLPESILEIMLARLRS
jgi:hypothetical protein